MVDKKVLIVGPTASGKSNLAHQLALDTQSKIISCDSRQSYKYLDIGTSKPKTQDLEEIKYFNISLFNPSVKDDPISFLTRSSNWNKDHNESSIYVGGSTLYQQVLLFGFDEMPNQNHTNVEYLTHLIQSKGIEWVFNWLVDVDPVYAKKMDGFNTQRIIRALDVFMQTDKPFSSFHKTVHEPDVSWLVIYPFVDRELVKSKINNRVDKMIKEGLIDEVKHVLELGYSFNDPGLKSIGYQEWQDYFENNKTLEETIQLIKTRTWQYAKRQITWLKRWEFLYTYEQSKLSYHKILDKILFHFESN